MASRTAWKFNLESPRSTTLGSGSSPTASRRASPKFSGVTCFSSIQSLPSLSMETRIRPLSSPCDAGFAVFGKSTSGPLRIWGAITMKMISSTSTTSTSGVMLMDDCILAGSPRRIRCPLFVGRRVRLHIRGRHLGNIEQGVHELGRSPVHLDMEILNLAREVVEGHNCRNCDEDSEGRRNQCFSDTARHHRHSTGPCSRDALKRVDDSNDRTEEAKERRG